MGKIAVLRLDAIGDFVIWLPVANYIVENELNKKNVITLFCQDNNMQIAKREIRRADEIKIVCINENNCDVVLKEYQDENFDILFQCSYSSTRFIDFISSNLHANKKVSIKGDKRIYDEIIYDIDEWEHEYTKNLKFAQKIYGLDELSVQNDICLGREDSNYFVISPFGSFIQKSINEVKIIYMVEYLLKNTEYKCVFVGVKNDHSKIERMLNELDRSRCENMAGLTDVIDYWDTIKNARFVLGNDSSCIHIAAYCKVPSVCFAGGAHWGRFLPYDSNATSYFRSPIVVASELECFRCNYIDRKRSVKCNLSKLFHKRFPCIENIAKEDIEQGLIELMNQL